jgi:hypothetical protein
MPRRPCPSCISGQAQEIVSRLLGLIEFAGVPEIDHTQSLGPICAPARRVRWTKEQRASSRLASVSNSFILSVVLFPMTSSTTSAIPLPVATCNFSPGRFAGHDPMSDAQSILPATSQRGLVHLSRIRAAAKSDASSILAAAGPFTSPVSIAHTQSRSFWYFFSDSTGLAFLNSSMNSASLPSSASHFAFDRLIAASPISVPAL